MADPLQSYRAKRETGSTPEPEGAPAPGGDGPGAPRFVIQEHHASHLHWDLRLEHQGVLASWALPKGVPAHPDENRLAVRTEDHPLEYLDFHGEIPEGSYGAGTMGIWDAGTYEVEKFRENEVIVVLEGDRVRGRHVLFKTGGRNWMIHRMDPPEDPSIEPMPEEIRPMLARLGDLPADDGLWGYEVKWDGVRAVAHVDAGHLTLTGRNGTDFTPRYPEVRAMAEAQGSRRMVLDGEVVAFDSQGRPSFELLQSRIHLGSDSQVRRKMREVRVAYVAFDLLWLEGHSTLGLAYADRRRLLGELELEGPSWRAPSHREGDGAALLEASAAQGLEGIVAKRLDSVYEPGRRSAAWIKIKNRPAQDVVVGGWLSGEGGRASTLGALAVGVHDEPGGDLHYAGKVGTGFTRATLASTLRELSRLEREDSPFTGRQPPRGTHFVEPRLVAQVQFAEWTRTGTLRAPSFKGLREDIDPDDVVREG
jgi:bifunctional non-homologous end joining protein LigD